MWEFNRAQLVEQIGAMVREAEKDYAQALKSNQEFWETVWKLKHKEEKQEVLNLQK